MSDPRAGDPPVTDPEEGREHATCIVVGETGILIRGASGSGKSSLALDTVARAGAAGIFASLVADDRVALRRRHGRLIAGPDRLIAGRVEIRGLGLVAHPHEDAAVVGLVVERDGAGDRYPDESALWTDILGIRVARAPVGSSSDPASLVLHHWRALRSHLHDTPMTIS